MRTSDSTHSSPTESQPLKEHLNPHNGDTSREIKDFLKSNRWLKGPAFLRKGEDDWPKIVLDVMLDASDKEVRKEATTNAISVGDVSSPTDQLITYFSDWRRLKIAVAWFLRLKDLFWWSEVI